jgi:hypothetical protein
LIGALIIAYCELSGGYLGDSSMIPGCLGVMCIIIGIVVFIGFLTGQVIIMIK